MNQADVIEILTELCEWKPLQHVNSSRAVLFNPATAVDPDYLEWWKPVGASVELEVDDLPPISTDETAVFTLVVPAMKAHGYRILVGDQLSKTNLYEASFWRPAQLGGTEFKGESESPAEAICLAALAMIRGRVQ